jgi:hypothetical protein
MAVSPQRIYEDLADNGQLDGKYSQADIARALDLRQVVRTDAPGRTPIREHVPVAPTASRSARRSGHRLPFTGLDLALLLIGGGPLLLIGVGLKRRLAPGADARAEVVGG